MLSALVNKQNPDMTAEIYGTLHNKKGIKIRLANVEHVSDALFLQWKGVMWKHGYNASITHVSDLQQVDIVAHERYSITSIVAGIGVVYLVLKILIQIL